MLKNVLLIGAGGFIGSVARYFVSMLNLRIEFLSIPVGTMIVNVAGSLILGFLTGIADKSTILTTGMRLFLWSGFAEDLQHSQRLQENLMLLHNGQTGTLLLYTALSIILGFSAVYLGYVSTNLL